MSETIQTKRCCHCKKIKSTSEFYKNKSRKDGLHPACKICVNAETKRYSQTEKGKATHKRYDQSNKGKIVHSTRNKRYNLKNPELIKAHNIIKRAIAIGKIPRPDILQCHYCLVQAKYYHHHKGYAKKHRLNVVPICPKCHRIIHNS